jgi:8-oxo-dGTP pyrophosphatase MutT (NUDIX family)
MSIGYKIIGRIAFWISWPGLVIYLGIGVRVRVIINHSDKILLTRNWYGNGHWALPGGGQKTGETLLQTAVREVLEETGIELNEKLLQDLGQRQGNISGIKYKYNLYMANLDKLPSTSRQIHEISEMEWLSRAEILASKPSSDLLSMIAEWSVEA